MAHIARLLAAPRLQAGRRQRLLPAGADPRGRFGDGSAFGLEISYSEEPEPLGTAGGVGKVRDFLSEADSFLVISGDALTDIDLSGMRDRARGATSGRSPRWRRSASTTRASSASSITDEDGRVQGFQEKPDPAEALSDLANCGIYMFGRRSSTTSPRRATRARRGRGPARRASSTGRWTCSPRCSRATFPSTRTRSTRTGTTSAPSPRFVQGNLDALSGAVRIEPGRGRLHHGIYAGDGSDLEGVKVKAPVLIGASCRARGRVRPARAGRRRRELSPRGWGDAPRCVVLPGAEVPAGGLVVGGLYGVEEDRPLG